MSSESSFSDITAWMGGIAGAILGLSAGIDDPDVNAFIGLIVGAVMGSLVGKAVGAVVSAAVHIGFILLGIFIVFNRGMFILELLANGTSGS